MNLKRKGVINMASGRYENLDGEPEQHSSCMKRVPKSCEDKHFDAILAKNEIVRLMKHLNSEKGDFHLKMSRGDVNYILIRLRVIENFMGTLNQSSAKSEFESKW